MRLVHERKYIDVIKERSVLNSGLNRAEDNDDHLTLWVTIIIDTYRNNIACCEMIVIESLYILQ